MSVTAIQPNLAIQSNDNGPIPAPNGINQDPQNNNDLQRDAFVNNPQQRPRAEKSFLEKILYEGFKISLTIGLSIIASTFLTPFGGMIVGGLVSAAFSAYDQYSEKGKVDWTRVGIEFALGFVSMGVGKVAVGAAGKVLTKALSKPLVHAAVNSGVQGGFTGGSLTAYDTFAQTGNLDVSAVAQSFLIGGVVGAGMGVGIHKITNRTLSKVNQTASDEILKKPIPKNPSLNIPQSELEQRRLFYQLGQASWESDKTFVRTKQFEILSSKYGLMPDDLKSAYKWFRSLNKDLKLLEKKQPSHIDAISVYKSRIKSDVLGLADKKCDELFKKIAERKITLDDLARGSDFRKEIAGTLGIVRRLDLESFSTDFGNKFQLSLFLYSSPKFIPKSQATNGIKPLLLRYKESVSNDYLQSIESGIRSMPERIRAALRKFGGSFLVRKSLKGELSPGRSNFSRIEFIEQNQKSLERIKCVLVGKGEAEILENLRTTIKNSDEIARKHLMQFQDMFHKLDKSGLEKIKKDINSINSLTGIIFHESGHNLDRIIYYFSYLKKLNNTRSLDEYLSQLSNIKSPKLPLFSNLRIFRKAHLLDLRDMSRNRRSELKYFIGGDTERCITPRGRLEALAETVALLYEGTARITHQDFPRTISLIKKALNRFFGRQNFTA